MGKLGIGMAVLRDGTGYGKRFGLGMLVIGSAVLDI
jgi:hypothetical protein